MIELTKLSGERFVVNAELIECIEAQPDTSLVLQSGKRYVVRETPAEVVEKAVAYKRRIATSGWTESVPNPDG